MKAKLAEAKREKFSMCQVERTFERKSGHFQGHEVVFDTVEIVTEPCNTPLFGDIQCQAGVCRSCARGWTDPKNYPTEAGLARIQEAIKEHWQ